MPVHKKTPEDIEKLKVSGAILASLLKMFEKCARPGVSLFDLDRDAKEFIESKGAESAFFGYRPTPKSDPYPASTCASVGNTIVHGIPYDTPIKKGDIISFDAGVRYKGLITDGALTIPIGGIEKDAKRLLKACREALLKAMKVCKPGNTVGDIGWVIEETARKYKVTVVEELTGHGVGFALHEEPVVLNYGEKGTGLKLEPGMVIAVEPMFTLGNGKIMEAGDGGFKTKDGSLAVHFEKTIVITERGYIDLTPW